MSSTPPPDEPKTKSTPPPDFGWNLHQTLYQLIGLLLLRKYLTPPPDEPKTKSTPPPDFGWNLHQTLYQLIGFADFKGAALLAAAGVILTLFLQSKPTLSPGNILAVVFLVLCALCAGYAFLPFLPSRCRENKESPVFWMSIQQKKVQAYKDSVCKLDDSEVNKYYEEENCEISKDLMHRFVAIELSIVFLIVGLIFVAIHFLTT